MVYIQWIGSNGSEVGEFIRNKNKGIPFPLRYRHHHPIMETPDGTVGINKGDYIVEVPRGFRVVPEDAFQSLVQYFTQAPDPAPIDYIPEVVLPPAEIPTEPEPAPTPAPKKKGKSVN